MPAVPSPDLIRQTTEQVLTQPEFRSQPPEYWVLQIVQLLRDWADQLSKWSARHPGWGLVLIVGLLLILMLLVAHMIYVAFSDVGLGRKTTGREPIRDLFGQPARPQTENWRAALDEAGAALQNGNQRRAVWIGHRVLLGLLEDHGTIHFARGKTNSDYLRECQPSHPWQPTLEQFNQIYEKVIYAQQAADGGLIGQLLGRVNSCLISRPNES